MSSRTVHRIFPNRFDPGDLSSIYFAWDRGSPHPNRLSLVASYRVAFPVEIRECASSGCCLYFSMLISYRYCGLSLSHFFYRGIREVRVLTLYEQSVSSTRAAIPIQPISCAWV